MEGFENGQSANQIWKESNTTLSFRDWIQREKDRGRFLPNKMLLGVDIDNNSITGDSNDVDSIINDALGMNNNVRKHSTFFGLSKTVFIVSGLLIGSAFLYNVYRNKK